MTEISAGGLYAPDGRRIIETPSKRHLVEINRLPRAKYISTFGPNPETAGKWWFFQGPVKPDSIYFRQRVLMPAKRQIMKELKAFRRPLEEFALRGTYSVLGESILGDSFLNVSVPYSDIYTSKSLWRILEEGTEKGEDITRVASVQEFKGDSYVDNYLQEHSRRVRLANMHDSSHESIFPVILVYDLTRVRVGEDHTIHLPKSKEERRDIITRAYVLDYAPDSIFPG